MSLRSMFKQDVSSSVDGVWQDIEHAKNTDGTTPGFRLRRFSSANPKYERALQNHIERLGDLNALSDEQDKRVSTEFFVRFAVAEWRNVQEFDDGTIIPNGDYDALIEMLDAWEWVDLLNWLKQRAIQIANYRAKQTDKTAKN